MMKKTRSHFLTKYFVLLLVFILGGTIWYVTRLPQNSSEIKFPEIQKILDTYLQTPAKEKTLDAITHAFVEAYGDKYTQYFSPEETISFQTMINGDFEGIGAYVEDDTNGIYISWVLPGSPAQQAGLLPGDIIQSVNGETMHAKTANEAVTKIRGLAGTTVVLDIFSTALGTKKQVTLIRKHLEIPIIQDFIKNDTLVIQLFSFNDHSRDDVMDVLRKNDGKYKKILLDLRNNGGGTLQSAVDVASLFLRSGQLIATVDGVEWMSYVSHGSTDYDAPLYLLVNGQTASAAEILTAALHFHLKTPIFWSQTYGKWSVQQLFPLSNGGEIKVTIAHWRTPDNQLLDDTGITPTNIILPQAEDIISGSDVQLDKTISQIYEISTQK